jgi:uncharacterized protein YcfJ/predicted small lipoprotein YifL
MRSIELMPRSLFSLAAVALLVSACGEKKPADTPPDVAVTTDSSARAMMNDSVASVEVIPPALAPTVQEPLVAGRQPAPAATRPRPSQSSPRPTASNTPSAPTPAPSAPSAPARSSGIVAAGTTINVSNGPKVCSNTLQVGDAVTATTNAAINASNDVSIPAGSRVGLVVTRSKTSSNATDDAELAFDVRSVTFGGETYTMSGEVTTSAVVKERKGGDGKKVAIGAAAGAVIGNVIGGGSRAQRTVVGAAAGGAAGAAAAAMTGDRFACLPEGAALTVRLGSTLTVRN